MNTKRIVITGGPGSGKTTLINHKVRYFILMLKVYLCVILFGGLFKTANYTNPFIFLKKYNMKDTKTEEFYTRLQEQLKGDTTWPAPYLYKFYKEITPST